MSGRTILNDAQLQVFTGQQGKMIDRDRARELLWRIHSGRSLTLAEYARARKKYWHPYHLGGEGCGGSVEFGIRNAAIALGRPGRFGQGT